MLLRDGERGIKAKERFKSLKIAISKSLAAVTLRLMPFMMNAPSGRRPFAYRGKSRCCESASQHPLPTPAIRRSGPERQRLPKRKVAITVEPLRAVTGIRRT